VRGTHKSVAHKSVGCGLWLLRLPGLWCLWLLAAPTAGLVVLVACGCSDCRACGACGLWLLRLPGLWCLWLVAAATAGLVVLVACGCFDCSQLFPAPKLRPQLPDVRLQLPTCRARQQRFPHVVPFFLSFMSFAFTLSRSLPVSTPKPRINRCASLHTLLHVFPCVSLRTHCHVFPCVPLHTHCHVFPCVSLHTHCHVFPCVSLHTHCHDVFPCVSLHTHCHVFPCVSLPQPCGACRPRLRGLPRWPAGWCRTLPRPSATRAATGSARAWHWRFCTLCN
jgi:hypothetical protein